MAVVSATYGGRDWRTMHLGEFLLLWREADAIRRFQMAALAQAARVGVWADDKNFDDWIKATED